MEIIDVLEIKDFDLILHVKDYPASNEASNYEVLVWISLFT